MNRDLSQIDLKTALLAISDLFLPRVCTVCGKELSTKEKYVCSECLEDLPCTHFSCLDHNPMADRLNALLDYEHYEPYSYACALFYYSLPVAKMQNAPATYGRITQALKYERNFSEGKFFAGMLAQELSKARWFEDIDAIVPVPLHWTRRWQRGYNQAEIIAGAIREYFPGAAMDCRILKRTRATKSQAHSSSDNSRTENVCGAFAASKGPSTYRHILVVDDVFTSGNTLAQCHKALREALGVGVRISVATLAYAGF